MMWVGRSSAFGTSGGRFRRPGYREHREEPGTADDVLGILTAINLHTHRDKPFAKEFRASATQRCAGDAKAGAVAGRAQRQIDRHCDLIAHAPYLPPLSVADSLMQDVEWAAKNADPPEDRAQYKFKKLLLLATVEMPSSSGGAAGPSSERDGDGNDDASGSADDGGGKKKKRKKAAQQEAAMALASQLEGLTFARVEEEVLAANAEFSVLLNAAGRTRQLLLCLSPQAIRSSVPAMHAAMGDGED